MGVVMERIVNNTQAFHQKIFLLQECSTLSTIFDTYTAL